MSRDEHAAPCGRRQPGTIHTNTQRRDRETQKDTKMERWRKREKQKGAEIQREKARITNAQTLTHRKDYLIN